MWRGVVAWAPLRCSRQAWGAGGEWGLWASKRTVLKRFRVLCFKASFDSCHPVLLCEAFWIELRETVCLFLIDPSSLLSRYKLLYLGEVVAKLAAPERHCRSVH